MRNKFTSLVAACWFAVGAISVTQAEVVIIVNPGFAGSSISKADFVNLYMGRATSFPGGGKATPLELGEGAVRDSMLSTYLGKTSDQMSQIWSRLVFSGNAKPLEKMDSDKAMVARVAADASAIGYVDANSVDSSVKVISVQ